MHRFAVCKFQDSGTVHFVQRGRQTQVFCNINNPELSVGSHGLHVHEYGDLTSGCTSTCKHYNPTNTSHGGRVGCSRHRGDMGNIVIQSNGRCDDVFLVDVTVWEIVGRALVLHEDEDDLGQLDTDESRTTGTAGKRIDCGVIGICKRPSKKICS